MDRFSEKTYNLFSITSLKKEMCFREQESSNQDLFVEANGRARCEFGE